MLFKKILFYHIVPALLAALICLGFVKTRTSVPADLNFSSQKVKRLPYIPHFKPYDLTEQVAFSIALKRRIPVLMGSSELTSTHLEALAHNFFNKNSIGDRFLSMGHAGFQNFGILTVLAANRQLVRDAKITIILSPGWFEEQYCKGTSLKSFFEYATPNYLYQVLSDTGLDKQTCKHIEDYVTAHFDQISKPDATLRLLSKKQTTALNDFVNAPFEAFARKELQIKTQQDLYLVSQKLILKTLLGTRTEPYYFHPRSVSWDSLIADSKTKFKAISNNNAISVENSYYDTWLKNKRKKRLVAVSVDQNQEYKDLAALLHFLKEAGSKPLFVIMPLNTKAHENLSVLKPTIEAIDNLLKENNFKCLNMFQPNLEHYEDGVLEDIMHPYNAGWYQIDKFISENYHDGK